MTECLELACSRLRSLDAPVTQVAADACAVARCAVVRSTLAVHLRAHSREVRLGQRHPGAQMHALNSFNAGLARKITGFVGTMWCAYLFAAIALISLPAAIRTHDPIIIVAWVAQTFLQLVLLSIIMVGQDQQAMGVAQKIDETHDASLAEFELAKTQRASHVEEMKAIKQLLLELHHQQPNQ